MDPLFLGPSGRPVYTEHEVEVITCSEVTVEGPEGLNGTFLVRLTNFRFLFQDTQSSTSHSPINTSNASQSPHKMIHWLNIANVAVGKSFFFWRSTNLTLHLYNTSNTSNAPSSVTMTLSNEQFDKFVRDVQLQQDRQSWVRNFFPIFAFLPFQQNFTRDMSVNTLFINYLASLSHGIFDHDW